MAKETKRRRKTEPSLTWCVAGTLAWFSVLGRALSKDDLHKLLLRAEATPKEIDTALKALGTNLVRHDGLYSVAGSQVQYPTAELSRWYRYKWWRVRLVVSLLRWVPYVRMVAVANTLADQTADKDSDIDVFIITAHGRLYFTRFLITGLLQLTGLRRTNRRIANRICLSFFATTNHRDLRSVAVAPYDIYLAYWIAEMIPVLVSGSTYHDFLKANEWVAEFVPRYANGEYQAVQPSLAARPSEWFLNRTFGIDFERSFSKWQRKRIAANPVNPDPDVNIVVEDDMLKFHEKDRRRVYREQWEGLMRQMGYDPEEILA